MVDSVQNNQAFQNSVSSSAPLSEDKKSNGHIWSYSLCCSLALLVLIGAFVPRALAFLPSIIGLISLTTLILMRRDLITAKTLVPIGLGAGATLFAGLSSFWAIDPDIVLERLPKMALALIPACMLLSALQIIEPRNLKPFLKLFPILLTLALLWNSFELLNGGLFYQWTHDDLPRPYIPSFINRQVILSILCLFLGAAALKHSEYAPKIKQALGAIWIVCTCIIITHTDSQSSHLALVSGLIFYFLFPVKNALAWRVFLGIFAITFAASPFLVQYAFDTLPDLISDISWFQQSYALDRLEIWDFVSRYAMQNPLYGFGIEATRAVQDFDTQMLYHQSKTVLHPHNFALQIWIEFGMVGVVIACAFLFYLFDRIKKLPMAMRSTALASTIAFLSAASSGYGLWQGWWIGCYMMLFAYAVILLRLVQDADQPQSS